MTSRRSALVTGATGFVGSNLVRRLSKENWDTHIVARPDSDLSVLSDVASDLKVHIHDGSTDGLVEIVGAASPKVVFHLASLFLAQHSSKDVEPLVASNVLFPVQLAQAMCTNRARFLINAGTSWQHYKDAKYNPVCLYAATKQAFEDVLSYYVEAEGLRVVTLKLFDTYGPGDRRPKLFSALGKAAATQDPLSMSPGEQLLDLVYIDDVVSAFMLATELVQRGDESRQEYAVSAGKRITLRELVALYQRVAGKTVPVKWGARPYRDREVMIPYEGFRPVPGWTPTVSLEEGIKRTVMGSVP